MPDVTGKRDALASWSGEIIAGTWVHIAIVNDPATHDTVMYVEGAPVLRNSSNVVGLATLSASSPWVVGGGSWDGARAVASSAISARCGSPLARWRRRNG